MTHPVLPPARTVPVELIGGPMCGAATTAPLGPGGRPPPEVLTDGGRYLRADRPARAHSGALRPAYTWQAG
jgi:hypothetical protein